MHFEYKALPVTGINVVDDEKGIIEALVSVTGIQDRVKDVIEPGAYHKTLTVRRPKGIWHHSWTEPIAKTLAATELMPGDKGLPKTLPDGVTPWPREAGGLKIRMQFNLTTDRGSTAYKDVKFFGNEQEWSIGYNVPAGGAHTDHKSGVRYIREMDLYEYSPVLFGAMPHARTLEGVKDAQVEYKSAQGIDIVELKERLAEYSKAAGAPEPVQTDEPFVGDDDDEANVVPPTEKDEEDWGEGEPAESDIPKSLHGPIRNAIKALTELLEASGGTLEGKGETSIVFVEAKATGYETLTDAVEGEHLDMSEEDIKALQDAALAFDKLCDGAADQDTLSKAAGDVMDILEDVEDDETKDGLTVIARVLADLMEGVANTTAEEADGEKYLMFGIEAKMVSAGSRMVGWPVAVKGDSISPKRRTALFIAGLDDEDLDELKDYLDGVGGSIQLKRQVEEEYVARDSESKASSNMDALGKKGYAFKNAKGEWSYPIESKDDLGKAIQAYGRCMPEDKMRLKSYIMKRAKELGADDMIPEGWVGKSETFSLNELKDLGVSLDGLLN